MLDDKLEPKLEGPALWRCWCGSSALYVADPKREGVGRVQCCKCGMRTEGGEALPIAAEHWNRVMSRAALPSGAEPVGYVDRLSYPTSIRDREEPGFEMPVFASPLSVTEARVEAAAREMAQALYEGKEDWIEYQGIARAALVAALSPVKGDGQ